MRICKTQRDVPNSGGTRNCPSVSPPCGRIAQAALLGSALLLTGTATVARAQVSCSYVSLGASGGMESWRVTATNVPDPAGSGAKLTVTYFKTIPQGAPPGSGGPANVSNTQTDPPLTATGYGNNGTSFRQGQVDRAEVYNNSNDIFVELFMDTMGGMSNKTPVGWVNSHSWGNAVTGSGHQRPQLYDGTTADNTGLDSDAGQASTGGLNIIVQAHNTCGL